MTHTAQFRFYADLNFFLSPQARQQPVIYRFEVSPSVKDAIESLGVPHPEVALILANSESVAFDYLVQPGDFVSVYPLFAALDVGPVSRVLPPPLAEARFVLDVHLGRLANYLRMLGFDSRYRNDYDDDKLADIAAAEQRILLTRDRGLLKRSIVTHGYCLRTTQPRRQLLEVLTRFKLAARISPFKRCLRCNGLLHRVSKSEVLAELPPQTQALYQKFWRCADCQQIYWQGSHYQRMQHFIAEILAQV